MGKTWFKDYFRMILSLATPRDLEQSHIIKCNLLDWTNMNTQKSNSMAISYNCGILKGLLYE